MRTTAFTATGWKKASVGALLAASLLLTPATVASATTAEARHSSYSKSATAGTVGTSSKLTSLADLGRLSTSTVNETAEKRGWLRPLIDWIKKNVPALWNGLVKAVKNGWNAFKKWWNSLSSWVRGGINFIVQGSVWELFAGLWGYFF